MGDPSKLVVLDCRAIPLDTQDDLAKRADEVGKMLSGLRRRISEDLNNP